MRNNRFEKETRYLTDMISRQHKSLVTKKGGFYISSENLLFLKSFADFKKEKVKKES